MHDHRAALRLGVDRRARHHLEAAEHLLARAARQAGVRNTTAGTPIRRSVGRPLIRLGQLLAGEPDPTLQPARPR